VGHEVDRQYLLCVPSSASSTKNDIVCCYNSMTTAWTTWDMPVSAAVAPVSTGDLYMGWSPADTDTVHKIRKQSRTFTYADFSDNVVVTPESNEVTLTTVSFAAEPDFAAGWGLVDENGLRGVVLSVAYDSEIITAPWVATLDKSQAYSNAVFTAYEPIQTDVLWIARSAKNPGIQKQFSDITWFFDDPELRNIASRYATNYSPGFETVTLQKDPGVGWGAFPWGAIPWGGAANGLQAIRALIPRSHQRCTWIRCGLSHRSPFQKLNCLGVSFQEQEMTERQR
jgi:hypothetical protein